MQEQSRFSFDKLRYRKTDLENFANPQGGFYEFAYYWMEFPFTGCRKKR